MREQTVVIPAPAGWINSNQRLHRMQVAALTKAWRNAAYVAARQAKLVPMRTPVRIIATIWKPRANRYDPNNLNPTTKACVDGLVDAGVIPDDSYKHVHGPDHRHGGKGDPAIVLEIREIGTTTTA